MGWWRINADTLAGSRFILSPLAEAVASLIVLERASAAHPGERAWLDAHLPAYRSLLTGDRVTASLVRAALRRRYVADFLTPAPAGEEEQTFEEEVAGVRRTSPETARADLAVALRGPLPSVLDRGDLPERAADLLAWVWTETVLTGWPRRRRIIEADIVARTGHLSRGGWAAVVDDMRPGMRWLGGDRLQINTTDNPPREISGARMMFVPVTPRTGWVGWDTDSHDGDEPSRRRYAVVYPCSGALAGTGRAPVPEALGSLLGPARAGVLVLLADPKSTSQLVALTGQGLGSVGRHLKVLLDARLVRRGRAGRSVLYYRTNAGEVLVNAQSTE